MRYDPIRARVTAICKAHGLRAVEVRIIPGEGLNGYIARAMPEAGHPTVEARWRIATTKAHMSHDDFVRASDEAMLMEVAHAFGSNIEAALKALHTKLAEYDHAPAL